MRDRSGQTIGRYHLIERVGKGGMAVVYRADDLRLKREVAIKFILTDAIPPNQLKVVMTRFEREALALAKLEHSNIIRIHDYGDFEGEPYLVMNYLPGGTLKQYTGQQLPYKEAFRRMIPVARALEYAHDQGIIHRDVKPANILITSRGEPMLSDFGIARLLQSEGETLTGTGMGGIGTPEYMAPEQWSGLKVGPPVDIYSLGMVLYELITGRVPFKADTPYAILMKVLHDPLPRPSAFVPGLPPRAEQVLMKALAKDEKDRFSSMGEMIRAMESLAGDEISPAKPAGASETRNLHGDNFQTSRIGPPSVPSARGGGQPTEIGNSQPWSQPNPSGPQDRSKGDISGQKPAIAPGFLKNPRVKLMLIALAILCLMALACAGIIVAGLFEQGPLAGFLSPQNQVEERTWEKDGMLQVLVPAGSFEMGSMDGEKDEQPPHMVTLDAFWMDKTEITNAMFSKFTRETGYRTDAEKEGSGWTWTGSVWEQISGADWAHPLGPSSHIAGKDRWPVVLVSWNDASEYCAWAGKRLPSEAEWEKAARGTDGRIYPWGNRAPACNLTNYNKGNDAFCVKDSNAVGSYPDGASPYGVMDMAGNVWEWVNDWYGEEYYASSPSTNPPGPVEGISKVLRGGGWYYTDNFIRTSYRNGQEPGNRDFNLGFRCASSPLP